MIYPPANGCQPISWFGWATTAWHDGAGKQPTTGHAHYWFGSHAVGCGMRSGQMYMRNRYYDPQTGQFTQTDPIGLAGGLNSYGFAAGDPVGYSDPYGLRAEDIILQLVWTGPGSYHTSIRITLVQDLDTLPIPDSQTDL